MKHLSSGSALLTAVVLATSAAPALAETPNTANVAGCVSNAAYSMLSTGQTLSYVRTVAGDGAQVSMRRWTSGVNAHQERLYAMCTPRDRDHATLTTRFMYYQGAWRAYLVDTHIGPYR